jgi:hypothetical protein
LLPVLLFHLRHLKIVLPFREHRLNPALIARDKDSYTDGNECSASRDPRRQKFRPVFALSSTT